MSGSSSRGNTQLLEDAKIAIIGAGAAGLATSRVLSRCGFRHLTVFEKESCRPKKTIGGVWNHVPNDPSRPMYRGLRTNLPREIMAYREKPWGSDGKEMSFVTHGEVKKYLEEYANDYDLKRFIKFGCTVKHLSATIIDDDDATTTTVTETDGDDERGGAVPKTRSAFSLALPTSAANVDDGNVRVGEEHREHWPKFKLTWTEEEDGGERSSNAIASFDNDTDDVDVVTTTTTSATTTHSESFDAVCICNGHYAQPSIPPIPGMDTNYKKKGKVMHSMEYDDPNDFTNQSVLCIGGRASGSDLAREISSVAKRVWLSDPTCPPFERVDEEGGGGGGVRRPPTFENVHLVPRTREVTESHIVFGNKRDMDGEGSNDDDGGNEWKIPLEDVDVIIFCSGYDYKFPFIDGSSNIELTCRPGERMVAPLYRQLWHARFPNLSFVGLPHSILPFPFFELQAETMAAQFLGTASADDSLPPLQERLRLAKLDEVGGGPKHQRVQDTHYLGSYQWDYCRTMAKMAGLYDDDMERYIASNEAIYNHANGERTSIFPGGPDSYRYTGYIRREEKKSFDAFVVPSSTPRGDDLDDGDDGGTAALAHEDNPTLLQQ